MKEFPSYLSRTVTGLPRLMQTKGPIRLRLYGNRPTAIGLSPQREQVGLKNLIISIRTSQAYLAFAGKLGPIGEILILLQRCIDSHVDKRVDQLFEMCF